MLSHIIKLRTECNIMKLKLYLTRFFQQEIEDSRYIFMQLSFLTVNNILIKIGENRVLDLKKSKDIKSYRLHIEEESLVFLSPSYEDKVIRIVINYTEISRKEYLLQNKKQN